MTDQMMHELVDDLLAAVETLTRTLDSLAARDAGIRENERLRQAKEAAEEAAYQVRKNRP
jgi:hypothetical protein